MSIPKGVTVTADYYCTTVHIFILRFSTLQSAASMACSLSVAWRASQAASTAAAAAIPVTSVRSFHALSSNSEKKKRRGFPEIVPNEVPNVVQEQHRWQVMACHAIDCHGTQESRKQMPDVVEKSPQGGPRWHQIHLKSIQVWAAMGRQWPAMAVHGMP